MADKPEKTLKQSGVPFGARMVFRLQWVPFLAMACAFILTTPVLLLGYVVAPDEVMDFIEGVAETVEDKLEEVKQHRAKLVAMYGGTHG